MTTVYTPDASRQTLLQVGKATIYFQGGLGYAKAEVTKLKVQVGRYAQHERALFFEYVPKGARKARGVVQTSRPTLVVLEGWGHFDPDDSFTAPVQDGGVSTSRARHFSCDPAWGKEFAGKLDAYLDATKLKVALDMRDHDSSEN